MTDVSDTAGRNPQGGWRMTNVAVLAESIYNTRKAIAEPFDPDPWDDWDEMPRTCHDYYRTVAEAAIEAMELTEEWAVQVEGKYEIMAGGDGMSAEELARYEFRRWPSYGYKTEAVVSRLVSPWTES